MTTYLPVFPGIDMSQDLGDKRLTKVWLREYLRANPQKDFRDAASTAYVNGQGALTYGLVLEVHCPTRRTFVANVTYGRDVDAAWGYVAVVS